MPGMLQGAIARGSEEASFKMTGRQGSAALLIISSTILLLAACADKPGGPIPYNVSSFGTPDAPELAPLEAGYRIAPMDMLTVKVFKMPDLSGEYEVDLAGHISMPLIGEICCLRSNYCAA